jgi:hypothetical protein
MKKLTKNEIKILREKFLIKFCKEKRWNPDELTTGQMLIIIKHPDYLNPKLPTIHMGKV